MKSLNDKPVALHTGTPITFIGTPNKKQMETLTKTEYRTISFNNIITHHSHLIFSISDVRALDLVNSLVNFIELHPVDVDKYPGGVFNYNVAKVMKHIVETSNSVSELLFLTFELGKASSQADPDQVFL